MRFQSAPATFRVIEIPLFAPAGEGEHLWLRVQKSGIDTQAARRRIAERFGAAPRDVGCAGLKDAAAVAVQHFTGPARGRSPGEALDLARRFPDPRCRVLAADLHHQRLRTGQLEGNRFRAVLHGDPRGAAWVAAALRAAARDGIANHFGPQRRGRDGANARRGLEVLSGRRRGRKDLLRLWVSALQSEVFDRVLARRWRNGIAPLEGDLPVAAGRRSERLANKIRRSPGPATSRRRGLVVPSGPIPGARAPWATGQAGLIEKEAAQAAGWPVEMPRKVAGIRLDGSRRPLLVQPWNVACSELPQGVVVEFSLPPGSYASVLIGHLIRRAFPGPESISL